MPNEIDWKPVKDPTVPCRKCRVQGQIEYQIVESSCGGYEDAHYRCNACHKSWWIDGPDA